MAVTAFAVCTIGHNSDLRAMRSNRPITNKKPNTSKSEQETKKRKEMLPIDGVDDGYYSLCCTH